MAYLLTFVGGGAAAVIVFWLLLLHGIGEADKRQLTVTNINAPRRP